MKLSSIFHFFFLLNDSIFKSQGVGEIFKLLSLILISAFRQTTIIYYNLLFFSDIICCCFWCKWYRQFLVRQIFFLMGSSFMHHSWYFHFFSASSKSIFNFLIFIYNSLKFFVNFF